MQRRPFKISYTVISTSHLSPFAQIRSAAAKEQQQLKRYAVHYSACLGHPFALVKEVVTLILFVFQSHHLFHPFFILSSPTSSCKDGTFVDGCNGVCRRWWYVHACLIKLLLPFPFLSAGIINLCTAFIFVFFFLSFSSSRRGKIIWSISFSFFATCSSERPC